jgi:membrane protease subunit HflK
MWLFKVEDRSKTIRDISQSVINMLVGDRTILDVMGSQRVEIEQAGMQLMNSTLKGYELGIEIIAVKLQNIVPPKGVQAAFEDVNKAIQDMNRLISEGKEAYNKEIPKATGQADALVQVAKGYSAERVNRANGDVARFKAVYEEYRKAPDVTRDRLYYEMIESVFADEKGVELIDSSLGNFLPIKSIGAQTGGNR